MKKLSFASFPFRSQPNVVQFSSSVVVPLKAKSEFKNSSADHGNNLKTAGLFKYVFVTMSACKCGN